MLELNKIHHGDCYELIKNIPDKSIDCIYTDVPYLICSGGAGSSEIALRISKVQHSDLSGITDGINYEVLNDFIRVMKKSTALFGAANCRSLI